MARLGGAMVSMVGPPSWSHQPSICKKLALTRWNPVPMNVLPMTSVSKFVTRFFHISLTTISKT